MVTTNDEVQRVLGCRDCGDHKYKHSVVGYTARLNTINAAIGLVQLKYLDDWNEKEGTPFRSTVLLFRSIY